MGALFNIICLALSVAVVATTICAAIRFSSIRKEEQENEAELLLKRARENGVGQNEESTKVRAVELTGTQAQLADAGLHVGAAFWRTAQLCSSLAVGVLAFFLARSSAPSSSLAFNGLAGIAASLAVVVGFSRCLKGKSEKRRLLLERQLAQVEMQIAENSRSGLPVSRSIIACSELSEEPLKGHLKRLHNEMAFSDCTLSEGFENMAKRTGSADVKLLADVLSIQEQTGSNLADALDFLHETIERRLEMRQSLQSALAETKITKTIVSVAPWAIFSLLAFAPLIRIEGFWEFYSTNPIGWGVLLACIVAEAGILALISRLSDLQLE